MKIDIHAKSAYLLEKIANSIIDRERELQKPFYFSIKEMHIVEKFINELLKEVELCEKLDL